MDPATCPTSLPQDILDEILHQITDTATLRNCSLSSRQLLYVSRKALFSTIRVTSRNIYLVISTLTPNTGSLCTIPTTAPKVLSINGDLPFYSTIDSRSLSQALDASLRRFRFSIERIELHGVRWGGMARLFGEAMSGLVNVSEIELDGVVVSNCEEARRETVRFLDDFKQLSTLSVKDLHLASAVEAKPSWAKPLAPSSVPSAQCSVVDSASHPIPFPPLFKQSASIALSLDTSDALNIVQQFTSSAVAVPLYHSQAVMPRRISSLTFHRLQLSSDPLEEPTLQPGSQVVDVQNTVLANVAEELETLSLVASAYELMGSDHPPNDLSHSPRLHHVHFAFTDVSIRHIGGKPFDSIMRSLNTIPSTTDHPFSQVLDSQLDTIEITLKFTNWLGQPDHRLVPQLFLWKQLDDFVRLRLGWTSPTVAVDAAEDEDGPLTRTRGVKVNLDFGLERHFDPRKAPSSDEQVRIKALSMQVVRQQIVDSMGFCSSLGVLFVGESAGLPV